MSEESNTTKAWNEFIRPAMKEFDQEWSKYSDSGICDTEGRWVCKDVIEYRMKGIPYRVTFNRLQGYDGHKPTESCPYNKRQIANNMSKALTKFAKVWKKAYKKYGYHQSRWGKDYMKESDFIDAIW